MMKLDIALVMSQVLAFLIMLWILQKFAWPSITKVLDDRKQKIKSDLDTINEKKKELDKLIQEYNRKLIEVAREARQKGNEEAAKGRRFAQEMRDEAHEQVRRILEKAQAEAEIEVSRAKLVLKNDLINLIIESTQKVLDEKLDDENKQKLLIREFLDQAELK